MVLNIDTIYRRLFCFVTMHAFDRQLSTARARLDSNVVRCALKTTKPSGLLAFYEAKKRSEPEVSNPLATFGEGRGLFQSLEGKQRLEDLENCHYCLSVLYSSVTNPKIWTFGVCFVKESLKRRIFRVQYFLIFSGFLRSGNFEGVRESQGKQRGSEKSQGILKYCSLDQLFMHYFHNFCRLLGASRPPPGLHPCKHCRLVYIAMFYDGTKFSRSITFVYLVFFYWCRE